MSVFQAGWTLMGLGLVGVFSSLILVYIFVRILLHISKKSAEKKANMQ